MTRRHLPRPRDSATPFRPDGPSCLVLDIRLPGANGLDFQQSLARAGISIPIVFITAHGDVPMASRAMKAGAVEFLMKPFQKEDLLAAIHQALEKDRVRRQQDSEIAILQSRFYELTGARARSHGSGRRRADQ